MDETNNFTFFGERMDGGGKRVGAGPIITFTGGTSTTEWGASKARTLEDITVHNVVSSIKNSKTLTLMLSRINNMQTFKFIEKEPVDRFTIQIQEGGRALRQIHFKKMVVAMKIPVLEAREISGIPSYKLSWASYDKVVLTIVDADDPEAIKVV